MKVRHATFRTQGELFWTIQGIWSWEFSVIKRISLNNHKVHEWNLEDGYIIQSDPAEYDGFLYAVENTPTVEIWHADKNGNKTLLRTYNIPIPYYYCGQQTVRAYIDGDLYYIKALEETGYAEGSFYGLTPQGEHVDEIVRFPAPRKAVFCKLSKTNEEYRYALNNLELDASEAQNELVYHHTIQHQTDEPTSRGVSHDLIQCYALSTNGTLAWSIPERRNATYTPATGIVIEIPGEEVRIAVTNESFSLPDYLSIDGKFLQWWDENTLLFAVNCIFSPNWVYKYDLKTRSIEPFLAQNDEQVYFIQQVMMGSNVLINKNRTALFYMGQSFPSYAPGEGDSVELVASVPIMVDLTNGNNYVLYNNKRSSDDPRDFLEARRNAGQLALIE